MRGASNRKPSFEAVETMSLSKSSRRELLRKEIVVFRSFYCNNRWGKLDKTMLGILIQKRWLLEVALAFRDLLSRRKIF